jgi:alpha-aminoadipic semialdehyde synthase
MAQLLGLKDDILLSNLKAALAERLNSESRVNALEELGFLNDELINKKSTPIDTITTYLQNKLAFNANERDLILMRHEVRIEWPNGKEEQRNINLVVYGEQNLERSSKSSDGISNTRGFSAMAKTVGYPAAIAGE